jgi:hypothetical protein
MKTSFSLMPVALTACLVFAGCVHQDSPKTVRLALSSNVETVELSVNGKPSERITVPNITNRLYGLRLRHGDVLLLEKPEDPFPMIAKSTMGWLITFCEANQAALYVNPRLPIKGSIFSVPIYHWAAPYNDPRSMTNASFYLEGKLLGHRTVGFEKLLTSLEKSRIPMVFILGSRHDPNRGYAPWDVPHRDRIEALSKALSATGTKMVFPSDVNF